MIERLSAPTYAAALCGVLLILTADARAQTSPPTLTTLATLHGAPLDGINPSGVVIGSGGVLYGVTQSGGSANNGTVFSLTPPKSTGGSWTEAVLYNFRGGSDGAYPTGVVIGNGGVLYGTTTHGAGGCAPFGCGTVFSLIPPAVGAAGAWTEKLLYTFSSSETYYPANLTIGIGGVLYGTSSGGTADSGAVFSLTPPASPSGLWTAAVLYSFPPPFGKINSNFTGPSGLLIGAGGVLYGTTPYGGPGSISLCQSPPGGCGTVFSLTPPTSPSGAWTAATLYSFTGGSDGAFPAGVVAGSGGILYGIAPNGGASDTGVVFSLTPPVGTQSGGAWTETVLYAGGSSAGVVIGTGGVLYVVIRDTPISLSYWVVSLTPSGGAWTESTLYSFTQGGTAEVQPVSGLVIGQGGTLFCATAFGGAAAVGTVYSVTPPAGAGGVWTGNVLYAFTGGSPTSASVAGLAVAVSGVLYGVTNGGGSGACPGGCGTVFSLTPPASPGKNWTESVLYMFAGGGDGAYPTGSVVIGAGGVLYGTTANGGAGACLDYSIPPGCGTVFSLTPPPSPGGAWTESVLHSFALPNTPCTGTPCDGGSDGAFPAGSVAIGSGGVLYGTTGYGGPGPCDYGCGTVFQLIPPAFPGGAWDETVIYNFMILGGIDPLSRPTPSGLTIGSRGVLYGTTEYGGDYLDFFLPRCGSVFSLTPPAPPGSAWTETPLQNFSANDGCYPGGGVVIGNSEVLYGSLLGHDITAGGAQQVSPEIFSLTPPASPGGAWTEAVLHAFGGSDGTAPGGLAIGSGGVLYGTAHYGGSGQCTSQYTQFSQGGIVVGCGVLFELIPPPLSGDAWLETTLYNFTGSSDGAFPNTGVVIGSGGVLYGATQPTANTATIFSLQPGSALLPSINAGGVVNAASFTAPAAPGSIASAFGDFFLSSPLGATQSPLPTDISGASLQFGDGTKAPLFFVSGGQVNFQVPWELSSKSGTVTATVDGHTGAAQTMALAPFAPAIFTTNAQGSGQGAILDVSYRLVDASHPATAGSSILIFCTGLGQVTNQPPTGSPAPLSPLSWSGTPTVTIGGVAANVSFSGLAPGYVGLYQVNAQVPADLSANGAVPVVLQLGGTKSNAATIAVQ